MCCSSNGGSHDNADGTANVAADATADVGADGSTDDVGADSGASYAGPNYLDTTVLQRRILWRSRKSCFNAEGGEKLLQ